VLTITYELNHPCKGNVCSFLLTVLTMALTYVLIHSFFILLGLLEACCSVNKHYKCKYSSTCTIIYQNYSWTNHYIYLRNYEKIYIRPLLPVGNDISPPMIVKLVKKSIVEQFRNPLVPEGAFVSFITKTTSIFLSC